MELLVNIQIGVLRFNNQTSKNIYHGYETLVKRGSLMGWSCAGKFACKVLPRVPTSGGGGGCGGEYRTRPMSGTIHRAPIVPEDEMRCIRSAVRPLGSDMGNVWWQAMSGQRLCGKLAALPNKPTDTTSTPIEARLFSNLNKDTLQHEPGSLLGASVLVAGTAVGAGILALPQALSPAGLVPAATAISGSAVFSILTGLCVAEVAMNTMCELGTGRGVSLGSMARRTLGESGAVAVKITYTLLHYTLLVAYTAKAGESISFLATIDTTQASLLFAVAVGGLCYVSSPRQLDTANGVLVTGVIASFLFLLTSVASQQINLSDLDAVYAISDWTVLTKSLPVVALSFVFQNVVPVICSSLEGDATKIRTAIIAGISVPWLMFLLWTGTILLAAQHGGMASNLGDPLDAVRSQSATNAVMVDAFSLLAVTTSYIGFVLGLKEFLLESLDMTGTKGNAFVYPLVVIPPLIFAVQYPNLFYRALEFAGTYGVLLLFGIIPVAMVCSERYIENTTLTRDTLVPGGIPMLALLGCAATAIILDQAFVLQ